MPSGRPARSTPANEGQAPQVPIDEPISNDEVKISDQEFIIKGTAHLCDIEEYLNANLPVDDYDTLSGFML
ncbi:MAG: transporter associated domain-containing protein, partial [Candidatus Phytoplasma australasiaticum]|nr:transporter associated domain-containing protein [Candidatus Phytoplasma australasiaticum]